MNKKAFDDERTQDLIQALKETQGLEQLQYLEGAAEAKRAKLESDRTLGDQLTLLSQTAPILAELLGATGTGGPIQRMAIGMLQQGVNLGDTLLATAEAELQLEQAKFATQLQHSSTALSATSQTQPISEPLSATSPTPTQSLPDPIITAANACGIETQLIECKQAPSYKQLKYSIPLEKHGLINKWKSAIQLALGLKHEMPLYISGENQIAIEIPLTTTSDRLFISLPQNINWVKGERKLYLGENIDGQVVVDLGNEDTPQVLIAGTTGSGKSIALRLIAYCLLSQKCKVVICGGKLSDFEDFSEIKFDGLENTANYVTEFYNECDRRNLYSKSELAECIPWILIIDEYKGTVPTENDEIKKYDLELCEVARRGRGLKIHVVVALQNPSLRGRSDPDGLPPDLRRNLPLRIAFRCVDGDAGRMILYRRGSTVPGLLGKGDALIQSGNIDTRMQTYSFMEVPSATH